VLNAASCSDILVVPCRTSLHEPVVSLITLPLFHSFGQVCQLISGVHSGNTLVLLPRFDPQVVVCTQAQEATSSPPAQVAWAKVPTDPTQPTEVFLGERRWTSSGLTLEALLAIIDEVEGTKPPTLKTTSP